jgi:hypothetical protein
MPIPIQERYKHMFDQLRFASAIRFKIFAAWGSVYAALAAVFAWMQSFNMKPLSWIAPFLAFVITILFWLGELRNQPAIGAAKRVGEAIEKDSASEIPEDQRYFPQLAQGVRFGIIVNVFAIGMLVLLAIATAYLICNRGQLPQ